MAEDNRTNDRGVLMVFDGETGNAYTPGVQWAEARERLAAFMSDVTSNPGALDQRAEDMLCAIFTGRA